MLPQGRQVQFIISRIERLFVMTGTPQKSEQYTTLELMKMDPLLENH